MRVSMIITAICCGSIGPTGAFAQGRDMYVPAEVPPSSYTAPQYVDSTGCAFVRAGYGGKVEWVPRVTLSRQPVCGMAPTFAAGRAPVVAKRPVAAPVRSAKTMAPVGAPMARGGGSGAPKPVVAAQSPKPAQTVRLDGCPETHPYGQAVTTRDGRRMLRCTVSPGAPVTGPITVASAAPEPAPIATARPAAAPPAPTVAKVPKGYRAVWSDGRLNPYRGGRTESGRVAMEEIWTSTTPRRLVSPSGAAVIPPAPLRGAGSRLSSRSAPAATGR